METFFADLSAFLAALGIGFLLLYGMIALLFFMLCLGRDGSAKSENVSGGRGDVIVFPRNESARIALVVTDKISYDDKFVVFGTLVGMEWRRVRRVSVTQEIYRKVEIGATIIVLDGSCEM